MKEEKTRVGEYFSSGWVTVSGEVTAFLSLIFVLLISFILALTESASIQTTKNQKRLDVERAMFSLFGEYEKTLLESYEIFAIDASYQSGRYDENQLLARLACYGSAGVEQDISGIQLLTDNQGQAYREQVLAFMEERGGISLVQDLTGMAETWEQQEMEGGEVSGELDAKLEENGVYLPEESESLLQAKATGRLALILPEGFQLSNKTIQKGQQVSERSLHTGRGTFPARTGMEGIEERMLFEQYIIDYFSSVTGKKSENRNLDYELEYILCGKSSDEENLKAVTDRLLAFRFAMNYAYLMSSSEKQGEAAALALTITTLLLMPELEEGMKQLLLILWGYGESVLDIRSLLDGKRAAMMKNDENWQLQLSSLFRLGTAGDVQESRDEEGGLAYIQYLQILLFIASDGQLTMRTLDRVEQNLIQEQGLSGFRADSCVTKLKIQNAAEVWNGVTYEFPTEFGYF